MKVSIHLSMCEDGVAVRGDAECICVVPSGIDERAIKSRTTPSEVEGAVGEFVALLGSDTMIHPDWFACIDAVVRGETVSFFAGDTVASSAKTPNRTRLAANFNSRYSWRSFPIFL